MTLVDAKDVRDFTILSTASIRDVLDCINTNASGICFLIDDSERVQGVITDGDIRRALLQNASLDDSVTGFMVMDFVFVSADASDEEIFSLFSKKIRHIPVLDSGKKLVRVVSYYQNTQFPIAVPSMSQKELANVIECVESGWISSQGKFVREFEENFAEYCGTEYAVSVCNGTAALHLSLLGLDIGAGDEVIVPDFTFAATANACIHAGATPVFCDIEEDTWCMDPSKLELLITEKTKAIIPVHIYGHPAKMDEILRSPLRQGYGGAGSQNDIVVIEDAAEAHGAEYKGKKVGSIGKCGCFSFYGNKIITTGEGGMITTNDETFYNKLLVLRDHGMSKEKRYWHDVVGYNYRLTNIQAAIGVAQLEKIESFLRKKRDIALWYQTYLKEVPGITFAVEKEWAKNVFWMFSFLMDESITPLSRDELLSVLSNKDIDCRPFFYPLHSMPIYHQTDRPFPVTSKISSGGISLPSSPLLEQSDIQYISETILSLLMS